MNRNPLSNVDPLGLEGYSGTRNTILTEAIHNPESVPKEILGITLHSEIDTDNGQIGVKIEPDSELYRYLKNNNPQKESYKNNKELKLTAEGLGQIIKENFNKYSIIDLKICNLGSYNNKGENIIFAQKVSNIIGKKVIAYTAYITATKYEDNEAYFSGYYTNPILFRTGPLGRLLGLTTYKKDFNGNSIKKEFNPQ